MAPVIAVESLGKRFFRQRLDRPTTLKEAVIRGFRACRQEQFWGLREVTFAVPAGRTVGVIGRNGAGKSTLLRLIGGVGRPDEGRVTVVGRVGALLDLGAGMTDDLSGRENVFIAGVIAGMRRAEIRRRFDAILAFAELEEFIDSPLRTYSTGMRMRLAFAVAVYTDPDILLIDEVLAVGDTAFQRKCLARIAEIRASGRTILLVSHEAEQVRALCDQVLWLRQGRAAGFGPAAELLDLYEAASLPVTEDAPVAAAVAVPAGIGSPRPAAVTGQVHLSNLQGQSMDSLVSGDGLVIEVDYQAGAEIERVKATIGIRAADDTLLFDTNSDLAGLDLATVSGRGRFRLRIERLDLAGGLYTVQVRLFDQDWEQQYVLLEHPPAFQVVGPGSEWGVLNPPVRWEAITRPDGT